MAEEPGNDGGTPAPAPAPAPAGTGGESTPWYGDISSDPDLQSWVENKGWQDPVSALKSTRNLEKMVGAPADEVVRIPENVDNDTYSNVMQRLGAPESPDGYEFNTQGAVDEDFMGWFRNTAHEFKLPKSVAAGLQQKYDEYIEQRQQQEIQAHNANVMAEDKALQGKWGNGYDKNVRMAQTTAQALGFDENVLNALEQSVGYGAAMEWLVALGSKLTEDSFESGNGPVPGFGTSLTPDEAKHAISNLHADPNKLKALQDNQHPDHKRVLEERARLFSLAYPDQ